MSVQYVPLFPIFPYLPCPVVRIAGPGVRFPEALPSFYSLSIQPQGSQRGLRDGDRGMPEGLHRLADVPRGLVEPHGEGAAQVVDAVPFADLLPTSPARSGA